MRGAYRRVLRMPMGPSSTVSLRRSIVTVLDERFRSQNVAFSDDGGWNSRRRPAVSAIARVACDVRAHPREANRIVRDEIELFAVRRSRTTLRFCVTRIRATPTSPLRDRGVETRARVARCLFAPSWTARRASQSPATVARHLRDAE